GGAKLPRGATRLASATQERSNHRVSNDTVTGNNLPNRERLPANIRGEGEGGSAVVRCVESCIRRGRSDRACQRISGDHRLEAGGAIGQAAIRTNLSKCLSRKEHPGQRIGDE